ncbi:folate-binding protein [Actinoallomurus purpureus]|uniref:CAF17-like 4Fe-4S cluster assembly/insertion protein YgfZ n=1 Tax=Actinoallomurus purpureus TaxID=478114 RepID=UPI002093DFF2|nr:folate-binding protein [Actinoallomurus purpureus]MCO6011500.1 folate-binding protein [Actinoallomurus purpureus]
MDSPLLSTPGAVSADSPDDGVAAHYGEPFAEQRALVSGAAVVDRSNRGVVRVAGADRLRFLHSLTSQHLQDLSPYTPTEALLLSPHGHVEHHLALVDDGEAVWAHVEPGTAPELARFLDSMRFMLRVEVTDESESYAVVTLTGAEPPAGALVTTDGLIVPRKELDRDWQARPAGLWAYEALRIAAHRPRFGLDTDHRTIPHEVGWIDVAVHLNKGCYRGQETVARVQNLGRPPRRLVFLHLDGSVDRLPAHGGPIEAGGRTIGFVGSAARHYELGPVALGLIKRNVPVDEPLLADGVAATQEVIVPPDTGANAKIDLRRR